MGTTGAITKTTVPFWVPAPARRSSAPTKKHHNVRPPPAAESGDEGRLAIATTLRLGARPRRRTH